MARQEKYRDPKVVAAVGRVNDDFRRSLRNSGLLYNNREPSKYGIIKVGEPFVNTKLKLVVKQADGSVTPYIPA